MTGILRVEHDRWRRELSLALRFVDHFGTGPLDRRPAVREELEVWLVDRPQAPVAGPTGAPRQSDGTYRFVDLAPGSVQPAFRSPSGRWTRWAGVAAIAVPPPSDRLVVVELWPTARAPIPPQTTALRGVLDGPDVSGLRVGLSVDGAILARHTFADAAGEFVFPIASSLVSPTSPVPASMSVRPVLQGPSGPRTSPDVVTLHPAQTKTVRFTVDP